jgi:hypothetical protein
MKQGCGIGSGSEFSDFVDPDPDPYWESGSRICIEQKCWIRIRIRNKSIRIHNPDIN